MALPSKVITRVCFCVFTLVYRIYAQQPCPPAELLATDNLKEVIISGCTLYQQNINPSVFCNEGSRNCIDVWEKFSSAFKFQPRCNVSEERYMDFIAATNHSIPADASLFWENVYPFVQRYSNSGFKYTTVADTMTGYIGAAAIWCSNENGMAAPGAVCPGWVPTPDCYQSANRAFWIAASKNYGLNANGEIFIMLNASVVPIYATDTYLAVYEFPFLKANIVNKATVLLLNENPVKGSSMCDDSSLQLLAKTMTEKSITYDCIENRKDLATLFCLDFPSSNMCPVLNEINAGGILLSSIQCLFVLLTVAIGWTYC